MCRLAMLIWVIIVVLCACACPAVAHEPPEKAPDAAMDAFNKAVDFNNKADGTWGVSGKTEWYTIRAISEILIATYLQKQKIINQNEEIIKLLKERKNQ